MKKRFLRTAIAILFVLGTSLLAPLQSPAKGPKAPEAPDTTFEPFLGDVTHVVDGDTLVITRADGSEVNVRLFGVDAPEVKQAFGPSAKGYAAFLAEDRQVEVVPQDLDRYGRLVAEVILPDGRTLSREMVSAGLAWWYAAYAPEAAVLQELERAARASATGLWCDPKPISPWEFRKRGKGKHDQ